MLLALSPAYSLYIRNCRYYSLGVFFSLLVWLLWAPGRVRRGRLHGSPLDRRSLLRYAAAAASFFLLLLTQYMNAATLLATLPVFFLDRRDRQPRQYAMLGILWCVAIAYGALGDGDGQSPGGRLSLGGLVVHSPAAARLVAAVLDELCWFLRDAGTHEFIPWAVVVDLRLAAAAVAGGGTGLRAALEGVHGGPSRASTARPSWLPAADRPATAARPCSFSRTRRARGRSVRTVRRRRIAARRSRARAGAPVSTGPWSGAGARLLALRGWTLVVLTLSTLLTAAVLLPPDMGKGPMAEMRYVVPLLAVGAAMGGVALTILWIALRPAAPAAALLLMATNWLYFGFFAAALRTAPRPAGRRRCPATRWNSAIRIRPATRRCSICSATSPRHDGADLAAVHDLSADVLRPQAALLRSVDRAEADT